MKNLKISRDFYSEIQPITLHTSVAYDIYMVCYEAAVKVMTVAVAATIFATVLRLIGVL